MRDIYRRPVNYHELPSNWSNQDAVKYETIANIKGLQHFDNPLAGDQNATYGCKNVYQDESGNLTVRPSVRLLRTIEGDGELLNVYKLNFGELLHKKENDRFYLSGEHGSIEIGSGNVAIQEVEGVAYILCTSENKLRYIQYDTTGFSDVVPDIQNNNPNSLISSMFNLLTDKYYANILEFAGKASLDRPWDDYDIEYLQLVNLSGNIIYKKYIGGTQYIITDDGMLYGIGTKPVIVDLREVIDGDIHAESVCIWNDSLVKLSVITSGVAACYIIQAGSGSDALELVYSKSFDYTSSYPSYPMQNNCAIGWNRSANKRCVMNMETFEILFTAPYLYSSTVMEGDTSVPSLSYPLAETWSDSMIVCLNEQDLVTSNDYTLDRLSFRLYDCIADAVKDITVDISLRQIYYNDYTVEPILNEYATGFILQNDISVKVQLFHWGANTRAVEISAMPKFYSSSDSLTISANKFYNYSNDSITEVDVQGYTEGGVYDDGGTLFVFDTKWNLLKRYVKSSKFEMIRPVSDAFPLVSDIEDEVLTSFYLDNIHWFVTKHRIFGTGVANEQFSIKYFDPKKYFHFDETLTGAIRISDYSFWVFHDHGAYLVYKSTMQAYDELSGGYIETIAWLCTSTAESKGCDFENGLATLPITSYIVSVTSEDISYVQMHENVQTSDRILVPMTLQLRKFVSSLLNETASVKIINYRYNTIFFLNPVVDRNIVPALVYNSVSESWWYWEFPFDKILTVRSTETGVRLVALLNSIYAEYDLFTGYFDAVVESLTYHIYGDRTSEGIKQIEWEWESALLHFNSADYRKQLLFTTFMLGERESNEVSFEYSFEVYDKNYSDREWLDADTIVERAQSHTCRTNIAKFRCLQLCLRHKTADDYSGYTKPKFTTISFKYRLLIGGNML